MTPILALIFGVLGLAIGELIKFWQDDANPLLSAGLSVAGGTLPLIIDYLKEVGSRGGDRPTEPRPHYPGHPPQPWPSYDRPPPPPRRPRRGGRSLIAILTVLVLGGGAAYGISYGISYATGNETVLADRLVAQATGKAAGVTVKVEKVEVTAHYTKVKITATNQNRASATLPLFGNCQLVDDNGATLKPGTPFGGLEPISVPPNGTPVSEVITFDGKPSPAKTTLTLSFDTVFGTLSAERSLQVVGIKLKAEE
ncbi:hypothetical protein [Amycolatopsis sp. NPDC021455]|uniref:hypothetical protein n=1 Tax=Amycolatopsis sp. NPDC021455 TaxID=3154901 RepID=UPI0033CF2922